MIETVTRIIASVVCAQLLCCATAKTVGAMQQSGYKNAGFLRWLKRKDNLLFNRLCVLSLCLALATAITALCFSFLGTEIALIASGVVFCLFLVFFLISDGKYALKVPAKRTGRFCRLFAVYLLITACVNYLFIALLSFLSVWNGSKVYALIAYVPFAVMPIILPFLLCEANAVTGIFENARNAKFVKTAKQVLNETKIIRIGVVGSYGKTSVKNILKTLLSEKYTVLATPESYNTPMGIAKTVLDNTQAQQAQVFIAEMGARKAGDIQELCSLVNPDYAVFTGICEQHVASFGSLDNVWAEKSAIFRSNAQKVICGDGLKERVSSMDEEAAKKAVFAGAGYVEDVSFEAMKTSFTLCFQGEKKRVETSLLGNAAVENILLAATLAYEMGLTLQEIANGVAKLQPVEHRLQLLQANGVYILDDGYNCNIKGAGEAIAALTRFSGRKCIVTPGIVECGVLEEEINGELGERIAKASLDKVILVGETLVGAVKQGYLQAGGSSENLAQTQTLTKAQDILQEWLQQGDCVLFLNDLPDVY